MDTSKIWIYHITDVSNLPNILAAGGLHSESTLQMAGAHPTVIGHSNIKQRRLQEITVPCCGNRFVGEFVPFYFCPRSPMLFTINRGNTGRVPGCQTQIVHLVSTMQIATGLGREWAFSNGNAGAFLTDFFADVASLNELDWAIINSTDWGGERRHRKQAEFLLADFFPWAAVRAIGCYNSGTKQEVEALRKAREIRPKWLFVPIGITEADMIEISKGNLLEAPVEALINTVNTEGVMGKGIALQFKQAYPAMFKAYEKACAAGEVRLGKMHVFDLGGLVGGPRWIINFPTKGHWRSRSRLADIDAGLADLVEQIRRLGIRSIAVPPLGCGHGGLNWSEVSPRIEAALVALPDVKVALYPPLGAPLAEDMPIRTEKPAMTEGRAALLALMDRYLQGLLDPFVSLLEIHKLMYFMQEAGQNLKLRFEPHHFGPYAVNLRQVLIKLEGHYLHGYGDGEDKPTIPIEINADAVVAANNFLRPHEDVLSRMDRVATLIDGFEDPYGMELLSTMHWVMCHDVEACNSAEKAIAAVHRWSTRKQETLKAEHLHKAWDRLKSLRWDTESRSAIH